MSFVGTSIPQGTAHTYTSAVGITNMDDTVGGSIFCDQGGTLYIEQSPDGTNWDVSSSYTISAGDGSAFSENLVCPYWRIRYTYTGTQTAFRVSAKNRSGGNS